ncbi:DNA-deoxyinosine glycosylase [Paenibacillus mendelii]|uniref:DNA-deoxyinosine glycosylase n=1 Tax=Paenibacillus mendelii TaxID=206163 RepID=A0ABV6JPB6_9BACL|nr:DNA-deoxyinosine glycosylase [Paenibacillus mendelii]MCQ6563955.1 DNA-deoxyinosine glycosylase [Paenibacillus mendelii]
MRVQSFPPIIDERARVLVLGSMPGTASLEKHQYYGHPRNYFWPVLYGLFDEKPDVEYDRRIAFAQSHRFALWDVIATCERVGSLDVNIKEEQPNDIPGLIARYPGIRCLAFNGSKAHDTFLKVFGGDRALASIDRLKLPSTSPVPTPRMRSAADRLEVWRAVLPYMV